MYFKKLVIFITILIITTPAFAVVKIHQVTFEKVNNAWQCSFLAHRGEYWEFSDKRNMTLTGDNFDTFKSLDGFGAAFLGSLETTLRSAGYIGPGDTLIWTGDRLYVVLATETCMSLSMVKVAEITSINFTWDIGSLWRCKIAGVIIIAVGDEQGEFTLNEIGIGLKKAEFTSFVTPFINILKGNIKKALVTVGYMPSGEAIGWE